MHLYFFLEVFSKKGKYGTIIIISKKAYCEISRFLCWNVLVTVVSSVHKNPTILT